MRAYISGQITGKERTDFAIIMAMVDIAEQKGVEVYCAERDTNQGELNNPDISYEEIYNRDTTAVKQSDMIVLEVSYPSTGNGLEIMLAYLFDKRIVCVYQKDAKVSRMLLGMPAVEWIVYDDIEDLKEKFRKLLD